MASNTRTARRTLRWRRFLPIAIIAAGLLAAHLLHVGSYLSLDYVYGRRIALKHFVQTHFAASLGAYLLFYAMAIAFIFPAPLILTIVAGFLFDWWLGGSIAVLGATIGGSCLFLAARSAFGNVLRRRADGAVARFADGFRRDAFTYLLVLRLTPILPVAALNIAPALLGVRFGGFVAATFLGVIPGAMVYAFLGDGLDMTLKLAGRDGHVSVSDLITTQTVIALAGLSLLALLGIALKKWVLKGVPEA